MADVITFVCSHCDVEKGEDDFDRTQLTRARRKTRAMCRRCLKHRQLLAQYGLSIKAYETMLADQNSCCACCGDVFAANMSPHVDHNHATGVVRALLCARCNLAIGHLKESPCRALQAAQYLLEHEGAVQSAGSLKQLRNLCRRVLGQATPKKPKSDHAT